MRASVRFWQTQCHTPIPSPRSHSVQLDECFFPEVFIRGTAEFANLFLYWLPKCLKKKLNTEFVYQIPPMLTVYTVSIPSMLTVFTVSIPPMLTVYRQEVAIGRVSVYAFVALQWVILKKTC